MKTQQYIVTGHYRDEKETRNQLFGRLPAGYDGDGEDLDDDIRVFYWLESDENIVVGNEYGDFIVQAWQVA
jgi:hypothetical protein